MINEELFQKEYSKLNTRQKDVVDTVEGPVLVVAGPGTGKTQVLGLRVANILRTTEAGPSNILCLTYTDAGALNMRERLARFIGNDAYRVEIGTFHSFANNIIGHYPEYFHDAVRFSAAGPLEKAEIETALFASLPYGHALYGKSPLGDFIYRRDVMSRIENIKKAGYTPDIYIGLVDALVEEAKSFTGTFDTWPLRLSVKDMSSVLGIAHELEQTGTAYGIVLGKGIRKAISEAEEMGKTEPLGKWKSKFLQKGDDGVLVLKESTEEGVAKMRAVAEMYKKYEDALHARERYDFSDMILDVAEALKNNSVLRNELEERYQYVLLDEFQDTNEAQMSLVRAITSGDIHAGRPNVMAVGDDDQAIFKFQGAEISNITAFHKGYVGVKVIVLDTNYRSHMNILEASRKVVLQGQERLENKVEGLSKVLAQGNKAIVNGEVRIDTFKSDSEEYAHIAESIRKLKDTGENLSEVAIIARDHKDLQAILPYLDRAKVPYMYERSANVFDESHVRELVTLCNYAANVASNSNTRDELLPLILSAPYWGIDRAELFRFAVEVKAVRNSTWSMALLEAKDEVIRNAGKIIADAAAEAQNLPLEHLLDKFMTESGFREYYFGEVARKERSGVYYVFLASLKTFIEALREWREGEPIFARDVEPFVKLHRDFGISLMSRVELAGAANAVRIMTAHKSKGLEFDVVFLMRAHEKVWVKKNKGSKAPVPAPLADALSPAGDNEDDFIRLLYVAMTRAKSRLYISAHADLVRYLSNENAEREEEPEEEGDEEDITHAESFLFAPPFNPDEGTLLRGLLENYRLSVTHLNNFCNVETGPQHFVAQNLLRIPQPMAPAAVYGSAVDEALTEFISYPKYHYGDAPSLDHLFKKFTQVLSKGRLPRTEAEVLRDKGERVIANFTTHYEKRFGEADEAQVDFRSLNLIVGDILITGKIDLLTTTPEGFVVTDFKTGKPLDSWKQTGDKQIQLYHYKHQLCFYAVLLKHSAKHSYPIANLRLEFVEGVLDGGDSSVLEYYPTDEDVSRMEKLIEAVGKKIKALDFPNIDKYPKTLKGIIAFEDDLISGNI